MKFVQLIPLTLLFSSFATHAEELRYECTVSFDVKDKVISLFDQSVPCTALEQSKASIYQQLNDFVLSADAEQLKAEISRLEEELTQAESSSDWSKFAFGSSLTGNFVSTLGLAACVGTVGAVCAGAVIGVVVSKIGVFDSAMSLSEKQAASSYLKSKLREAKANLGINKKYLEIEKDKLINSFNYICDSIESRCL